MTQTLTNAYAVIIGVDENSVSRLALPTVAKDVQALYDVLTHPQRCGYDAENVKLCHGVDATKDNIFEAFYWLQDRLDEDQDATAIVYYSGHGMVDNRSNQYYLIPYDVGEIRRLRQRAIKADELGAEIAALQPQRLLAILDCCHAAGMGVKDVNVDQAVTPTAFPLDLPETKAIPALDAAAKNVSQLATGAGRAVLNSSTGAESSYIRQDGKMSIFTYHLIEALTGHAPYDERDATVLVTDVMSYVTRRVAETARKEGRQQTPVMRTTGVFPVALILGGEGVAKGMAPPDPLEELPPATPAGTTVTFNQEGQIVHGPQIQAGRDAHIGQIGDNITAGEDYVGGDKVGGDQYNVGNVSGDAVAIGRGARASQTNVQQDVSNAELSRLFASLMQTVAQSAPAGEQQAAFDKVRALRAEVGKGDGAGDERMAGLVQDIADLAPGAAEDLVALFTNAIVAKLAGGTTRFVIKRLSS